MMYFIRCCTAGSGEDSSIHVHFLFTQAASLCLAIYVLTTMISKDINNAISYTFVAVIVVLLVSPIAIPIKMTLFPVYSKKRGPPFVSTVDLVSGVNDASQTDPLLVESSSDTNLVRSYESEDASDVYMLLAVGDGAVKKKSRPKRGWSFLWCGVWMIQPYCCASSAFAIFWAVLVVPSLNIF